MKYLSPLLALFVSIALFSYAKPEAKEPFDLHQILKSNVESALHERNVEPESQRFILSHLSPVYSYVTIKRYQENGVTHLLIDEFNYDEWKNSITGEVGKSPHGTKSNYSYTKDGWEGTEVVNYGG